MSRRMIVLDGFGIGAMEEALGLMNAYGKESLGMKRNLDANYGKLQLMHDGADTFMGHQELMGTLPKKQELHPFQEKVDEVARHLA